MPVTSHARGDEPSMYLPRPSTGKSQDVRHILVKNFREVFTRDAIEPDTVKNLSVSKGGDDPYHERYVEALQKVFEERQRRMQEAAMLERHIMQAQARAMSADEREMNRTSESCDNYSQLGLPPARSNFRTCLDTQLLQKHKLLTPQDYATEEEPPVPPPAGEKIPSYARETLTSRQHTRDDLYLLSESPPPLSERSKSDIGSLVSEEPQHQDNDAQYLAQFPRNDAWKHQMSENQREQEKVSLNNLNAMVNYQRNPRFIPPSAPPGGRSLVKNPKIKAKDIGTQPKPAVVETPQEPSEVFLVSPPAVVFSNYKLGQVYEMTLTLKNVSSCIRQCRALPASTSYFSIGLGQFPGEHGLVAPGMSCHYAIRFNPDSHRNFDDEIRIQTQSRAPIIVPLLGRRPPPKLTLPPVIDVGFCLVGGCQLTQLVIKNQGGPGRFCIMPSSTWPTTNFKSVVRNGNVSIPPFDVRPSVLELGEGQTGLMEIVFQPPSVKNYSVSFCMVCDNCNVKHFKIQGEAQKADVELVSVERGMSEPSPGELTDSTAQHLIKFDQLNPFTYTDRTAIIKNLTNVSLPFQWMIYKPQFDSPGADNASKKYDRVPDVDSVFSVHPPTGLLPPQEAMEFKLTYAPPVVDQFHSVMHMLLNMVPASLETSSKGSSASTGNKEGGNQAEREEGEEDTVSEIIMPPGEMAPFGDVTALEIEVKGESVPLSVVLHPYSVHVPGKNLVGTTLKKMITMANHSHSTITFQWEPFIDKYILEVEPPFGELDPGMAMDMELCITGPEPGKIDHTLYCHVMNLEEPLHLQVQAEFKGPEVTIDEPDLNFGLLRLGHTGTQQLTINNMSQILTPWSIRDKPAFSESTEDLPLCEFEFVPDCGELKPLESRTINVTFKPLTVKSVRRVIELLVKDGPSCNVGCFAEVQTPQACLLQCEVALPRVYKDVPAVVTATILNQTLLPTTFEWGQVCGEDRSDCQIELEPMSGQLRPREEKTIRVCFTGSRLGEFSDLRIPCKVDGMTAPLVMALFCDVKGLLVDYEVSQDGTTPLELIQPRLDFGQVSSNSTPKMYVHVHNRTAIAAPFTVSLQNFFSKPPSPPGEKRNSQGARAASTRRVMLGKTPNLADPMSKTTSKAQADLCNSMLSQGLGVSFVPIPAAGTLAPFQDEVIEVTGFSDTWGEYQDELVFKIGELEETRLPVAMTVVGCPLSFQMTSGLPDLKPVVRFGTHVAGTAACNRTMRVKNTSPFDIRVDWEVYNIQDGDPKLMDMVVCFGTPFPRRDEKGNEIIPPTEIPEPVVREPTDYIPNSADSSQQVSREPTRSISVEELDTDLDTDRDTDRETSLILKRPKVVSVFCEQHQGTKSTSVYNVRPSQMVIPAKGHASMMVSFTPKPTEDVLNDEDCNGFIRGYLSLDRPEVKSQEGKLIRSQAYEACKLQLDMTAHLKPALLTIECGEEEGMRYRSAMSSLLTEEKQILPESIQVSNVMLSNLTLTPLTFRLVARQPFLMVDLDPTSNKNGSRRSHSTEMHTLRPRHNFVVKVAFQTSTDLLSEIAEDYINDTEAPSTGRKIEIKDNLVVEFNNGATQLVPLHATLTVPQFQLSKSSLDFGTCLVGQTRELQLLITNESSSHTYWQVSQETRSDTCSVETFCVEPTQGMLEAHITHISDSKSLLQVFFTAKHAEAYEAVFTFHGILGEQPCRLHVRGEGSYDGKHEAILNV